MPTNNPSASDLNGPLARSVGTAFTVLGIFTAIAGAVWLVGNCRPVPPGGQAVVLEFGRVVAVQQAGLVYAWPRPIENVVQLPSPEVQSTLKLHAGTARVAGT